MNSFLLLLTLTILLSACGSTPSQPATPALPSEIPAPASAQPESRDGGTSQARVVPAKALNTPDDVDVDLTQLSSTMVYSEVYAMMYEPESYLGKTVKMRGSFSSFEVNGTRYYACIVQDATACCEQGLEFDLKGDPHFPEDYPAPGSEITVTGVFDLYSEEHDGNTSYYIILRDAVLV